MAAGISLRHLSNIFVKGSGKVPVLNGHGFMKVRRFPSPTEVQTPRTVTTSSTSSSRSAPIQYVLDNDVLTDEQADFYSENGFLIIPKLVPQEKLDKYRQCFERICMEKNPSPELEILRDVSLAKSNFVGVKPVTRLAYFHDIPELMEYCKLPEVLKYVECFTGPDIMSFHTMIINKPQDPGTKSSRHPMHQDLYYFPFRPAERLVASWTAMEKIDTQNGCLAVLPGTHKERLREHVFPNWEGGVNSMYLGILGYSPHHHRVHLIMEAGDTVFLHPRVIHGSGMNKSTRTRKCISSHFASSDCYVLDEWEPIQENYVQASAKVLARKFKKRGLEWPTDYDPVKSRNNLEEFSKRELDGPERHVVLRLCSVTFGSADQVL
ncbi:phytanoyl-CoA dioxygenase, peroxisomal-like [Glandiceps talaboti]